MHSSVSLYRNLRNSGEIARRGVSVLVLATSIIVLGDQRVCAQPSLPPLDLRSELELGSELAKFRISANDFVQIMERITGNVQTRYLKQELKDMIAEVRKSHKTAVDVFTPFISLDNRTKFDAELGAKYAEFTNKYITQRNFVRTHSTIVQNKLNQIRSSYEWRASLPYLRRQYDRLDRLSKDWAASDATLSISMDRLLDRLN